MDKTTLKQKVAQAIKEMNKDELLGLYDDFVNETSYGDGYIYETAVEFNSHFPKLQSDLHCATSGRVAYVQHEHALLLVQRWRP